MYIYNEQINVANTDVNTNSIPSLLEILVKNPFLKCDWHYQVCVCVYEINVHLNSSTTKCRTLMPSILSYIVEIVTLIKMCILLQ